MKAAVTAGADGDAGDGDGNYQNEDE